MPKPKKSKAAREREAIHKKKIRQLERDIKIMQKDFEQTFAETEQPPKKRHIFPVVCASVMVVCLLILAAVYIYVNFFMI